MHVNEEMGKQRKAWENTSNGLLILFKHGELENWLKIIKQNFYSILPSPKGYFHFKKLIIFPF